MNGLRFSLPSCCGDWQLLRTEQPSPAVSRAWLTCTGCKAGHVVTVTDVPDRTKRWEAA